jgi:TonB-linked SusC/RagA family outer membrane protein
LDITGGITLSGTNTSSYGYKAVSVPNENMGLSGMDQGIPHSVLSYLSENKLISFLGRINYNLQSKYLFTVSMRADGSSKFSKENRWGYFPSGAFAWSMNKEKFMKSLKFVSGSKLRISYGVTGNNRISDNARYRYGDLSDFYSFDNGTPQHAFVINTIGNKDLKWESTEQIDIGYDLSLFKNRINFVMDLYRKTTDNLLLNTEVPYSSGTSKSFKNIGKVRNQGLELTLNTINIKRKKFSWESDINISFNQSKVLALAENEEVLLSQVSWTGDWNSSPLYIAKIGQPVAAFYGYVFNGVYQIDDFTWQNNSDPNIPFDNREWILKTNVPANGEERSNIRPGDVKYTDQNNDGVVNDKDRVIIGNPLPVHVGGFNNNITYRDFSLNVFFQWSYGNDVFNANRIIFEGNPNNRMINQYATYNNRWTPDNPVNDYYRIGSTGLIGYYSSQTVEDASFLRLKTIQLSYNIPKVLLKKISIQNAQIYLAGQNLYTWTNYSGMDPEVSVRNTALTPGFDYSSYARNRTYTLGLKIIF